MPSTPMFIVAGLALLLVAWIAGRLRSESPLEIALNAAGGIAFVTGLAWASSIGDEAFLAAGVASGGIALTAEWQRLGWRRRQRTSGP